MKMIHIDWFFYCFCFSNANESLNVCVCGLLADGVRINHNLVCIDFDFHYHHWIYFVFVFVVLHRTARVKLNEKLREKIKINRAAQFKIPIAESLRRWAFFATAHALFISLLGLVVLLIYSVWIFSALACFLSAMILTVVSYTKCFVSSIKT